MPTKVEKDAFTGTDTTGHEWDGIKELNTPLPKWWLYTFYASILFAVVWWVLYPSWPGINGYAKGVLGSNQRLDLDQRMAEAKAAQATYYDRLASASVAEINQDPELLNFALVGGQVAFNENCAGCHALGGAGQSIYPTLADDDWLWGGTLEAIEQTINYGIRNGHEQARFNEMPAFGEILEPAQIEDVTDYVLSLGGTSGNAEAAARGQALFAENCASCHGEDGKGLQDMGAPNLTDPIWLYGSQRPQIVAQIVKPRQGVMPAWSTRLDPATIKLLTVYVHSLGGGQ